MTSRVESENSLRIVAVILRKVRESEPDHSLACSTTITYSSSVSASV
jgi:hypothetical protein